MEGRPQFDSTLGGEETVPPRINIKRFASARADEIVQLNNALNQAQKGGLIFQRLPKLMRRRVMSHNAKRMPRKLREAHAKQLEKLATPQKNRKSRRRSQNLLQEYNRRQRKFIWLETHIWHAKRFQMTEKWGYKLANFPNDKSFRACYRASANHCLLQDISYYCCIELNGHAEKLIEKLSKHTDGSCGLTFGARAFINGHREGSVMLFHKGMSPFGAIGTVNFLWKPQNEPKQFEKRTLWIWCHPAIYNEVIGMFMFSLDLSEVETREGIASEWNEGHVPPSTHSTELQKLETHHVLDEPVTYSSTCGEISMTLLKDKLNRFRLTGPLSQAVLLDALYVPDLMKNQKTESNDVFLSKAKPSGDTDILITNRDDLKKKSFEDMPKPVSVHSLSWWKEFLKAADFRTIVFSEQRKFWQSMKGLYSPAQLPPHLVVGLTVVDPRYQLPSKRIKIVPNPQDQQGKIFSTFPNTISESPLWDGDIRLHCATSKLSNSELAKLRSSSVLVPGFTEDEINGVYSGVVEPMCIPVILLQSPGCQDATQKRLGFSSGWDIIAPSGWGMPLWMALIFRGAKPGGLRENLSSEFESGRNFFLEILAPDTKSGKHEAESLQKQHMERYFRLPPNKRPNYIKLGSVSPFSCCWNVLMNDWCQNKQKGSAENDYYVLRDKVKLEALRCIVNCQKNSQSHNYRGNHNKAEMMSEFLDLFSNMNHNCLVPVEVEMLGRGCPSDCALICVPTMVDFGHLKANNKFEGPVEPVHNDYNSKERKALRKEHQKHLKHLRKERVSASAKMRKIMDERLEKGESIEHLVAKKRKKNCTDSVVNPYRNKMNLLWLPPVKAVKDSCSRTVAGFVCKGRFSFSEARGMGLGYVPLPGIIHLMSIWTDKPLVLVRNPHSVQYRFGVLHVSSMW